MSEESVTELIKRELPHLLQADPSLRTWVLDVAREEFAPRQGTEDRFTQLLQEMKEERERREEEQAKWNARWQKQEEKWQEQGGLWQKQDDRWQKQDDRWQKQEELRQRQDEKWQEQMEMWKKNDERWQKQEELRQRQDEKWQEQMEMWKKNDERWRKQEELRQRQDEKWQEQMEMWKKNDERWQKNDERWRRDDERWRKNDEKWQKNEQRWQRQDEKWEESRKEFAQVHEEIMAQAKKFDRSIGALGARWGMQSEKTFRNALAGILEESFGVQVLNVNEYDDSGEVFGRPDQVELDVIIKNGLLIISELKSSIDKAGMYIFERKVRFYEKHHQRKADRLIVISPMIDPKAQAVADQLGIETYCDSTEVEKL